MQSFLKHRPLLPCRLPAMLLAVAAVMLASPAFVQAQAFNVSADLPVSLTLANGEPTDRVSGLVVDVALPILLGAGTTQVTAWSGANQVVYSTFHGLFDLPIAFIKVRGGLGIGRARPVVPGSSATYESAPIWELYVRGGLELFPGLDVHAGYHSMQGESKITAPVPGTLDVSATLYTVGMTLGF